MKVAFSSDFLLIDLDGGAIPAGEVTAEHVDVNKTFSMMWSFFKPFYEEEQKNPSAARLDWIYAGFENGMTIGYAPSSFKEPGSLWYGPHRDYSCPGMFEEDKMRTPCTMMYDNATSEVTGMRVGPPFTALESARLW